MHISSILINRYAKLCIIRYIHLAKPVLFYLLFSLPNQQVMGPDYERNNKQLDKVLFELKLK